VDEAGNDLDEVWGWQHLVSGGFVEYVDTEEEETTLIAMTMKDLALQREAVSDHFGGGRGREKLSCVGQGLRSEAEGCCFILGAGQGIILYAGVFWLTVQMTLQHPWS